MRVRPMPACGLPRVHPACGSMPRGGQGQPTTDGNDGDAAVAAEERRQPQPLFATLAAETSRQQRTMVTHRKREARGMEPGASSAEQTEDASSLGSSSNSQTGNGIDSSSSSSSTHTGSNTTDVVMCTTQKDKIPPFIEDGKRVTEIARITPLHVFFIGFLPPFLGSIGAILIALIFHNDEISNYNWQCGRARLPSLSRIINLPVERTFWQLFLLFHVPIRVAELIVGYSRYRRLRNVHCKWPWVYEFSRHAYFWVGLAELFFLSALSIVGERENIRYHVIFFYVFGFCGIGFMAANTYCHAYSLYYLPPYGRLSYRLKQIFMWAYIASVPVLMGAFFLYWKMCVTWAYDVFAICEYSGVLLNIFYHGCAFFDIRYKVMFSVRVVSSLEGEEQSAKASMKTIVNQLPVPDSPPQMITLAAKDRRHRH